MQFRRSYIAFAAVLAPLAGVALVTACGSSQDDTVVDSGPDVTTEAAPKEAAVEAATDAGCANDVDLTQYLPSADASIDVDAGGLDIAACTGCLKTSCGSEINTCNQDCVCRGDIVDVVTCVAQGGGFETCAISALSNPNVQSLFTCALGSCQSVCLPSDGGVKDGGGDAGINDAQADGG